LGQYFFGQVITAYVDDGLGSTKNRPAVIISSDDDFDDDADLEVIAITKGIESPCPPYHIVVHDSHTPSPETGLWYPCVAKCNWYRQIKRRRVSARIGHMPDELLDEIYRMFNVLYEDDNFCDWQ
jgi:mRNA-degrading endonuclease toxin of MazEF toxin-antitoxin module